MQFMPFSRLDETDTEIDVDDLEALRTWSFKEQQRANGPRIWVMIKQCCHWCGTMSHVNCCKGRSRRTRTQSQCYRGSQACLFLLEVKLSFIMIIATLSALDRTPLGINTT